MDGISMIGLAAVAALMAFANGSQLVSWLRSKWPVRPDEPIVDPDDSEPIDPDALLAVNLGWLAIIAENCESDGDDKGQGLAADLAVHLTERRFGTGGGS
ncbi:MAG TPA: hypothetical protein DCQ98_06020 [Planctomycetaceae bacterium]|nr:hypothetical protein [Planctomycetaceae bacterium]HRF01684.1 hypothetical protein [Pirellulaceae bacterium]